MKTPTQKIFKPTLLAASVAAILVGLTGCLDSGDGDKPSTNNLQMSGAVVDGFVANSYIWLDINGNKERDFFEHYTAYTDAQGYFSYRPASGTAGTDDYQPEVNYCADKYDYVNYRHCLETPSNASANEYQVCSYGGRDQLTGKLYRGHMCMTVTNTKDGLVVNPLTTLVEKLDDEAIVKLASWFGRSMTAAEFKAEMITFNTFDVAPNDNDTKVFKFAFQAHKLAETMAAPVTRAYNLNKASDDPSIEGSVLVPVAFEVIAKYLNGNFKIGQTPAVTDPIEWTNIETDPLNPTGVNLGEILSKHFVKLLETYTVDYNDPDYIYYALRSHRPISLPRIYPTVFPQLNPPLPPSTFTGNIGSLNNALNSALPTSAPTGSDRPLSQRAVAGEVATETVITRTTPTTQGQQGSTVDNTRLTNNTQAIAEAPNLNTNKADFKTITQTIVQKDIDNNDTAISDNDLSALSDNPDIPLRADADRTDGTIDYIAVGSATTDRIYLLFNDSSATDNRKRGALNACFIDKEENTAQLVTGSYEVDKDKKFILYMSALSQSLTVKNLKAPYTYTDDTEESCKSGQSPEVTACVKVEYKNFTTGEEENKYFGGNPPSGIVKTTNVTMNKALCDSLKDNLTALDLTVTVNP